LRKSRLRKTFLILLLLFIAAISYVLIVNRDSPQMTTRQKILKAFYPILTWVSGLSGKNTVVSAAVQAPVSFFNNKAYKTDGTLADLSLLKGKKILVVNTASDCGYTAQLAELEELQQKYAQQLTILAFPSNDFKEQEKGTDAEIAAFCQKNYHTSFQIMKKAVVLKNNNQQEVYQWLTDSTKNGWNNKPPAWNFCKYIIDENGNLTHYFGSGEKPTGSKILSALNLKD
jgi:glutathione peroxidase